MTAHVGALTFFCALLLGLCATNPAKAQGIKATIDRTEATVQDQLRLTVTVSGTQRANPKLPDLPDFDVYSGGTSSQMQIINGRMNTNVVHTYVLVPRRPGRFVIGAVTVQVDGKRYASKPFAVRIVPASARTRSSQKAYVTASVNKTDVMVSEQVVYTFRFYRRVRVSNASLQGTAFDGFHVEDLGEQKDYTTTIGGQEYAVTELKKALFAVETGTLTLAPAVLTVDVVVERGRGRGRRRGFFSDPFDDFFGRVATQKKTLRTKPIEITVSPLPPPPAGFSGLVGDFKITSQLSKSTVKAGESTTLTVTVSGTGNAQRIAEPQLPALNGFKIYPDKPTGSVDASSGRVAGTKSFRTALVPLAPGALTVPPVQLVFFDPREGVRMYRKTQTSGHRLQVLPADGREELKLTESVAPSTGKVAVKVLADDILPIYKKVDASTPNSLSLTAMRILWGTCLLFPPLFFFAGVVLQRRYRNAEQHAEERRRRSAYRRGQKAAARVASAASSGQNAQAAVEASRGLREYLGDKLGVEGLALTPQDARTHLRARGADETLIRNTASLLERCEAAQYGALQESENGAGPLDKELKGLLKQLERTLRP